jgi:hypothetical protein
VKPLFLSGYSQEQARDCERLLVTLLRGVGPLRESMYLIGGLTPRYIIKRQPPAVPHHAGTKDVDVVLDVQLLTNTEAYRTLEENFAKIGLQRGANAANKKVAWKWVTKTEHNAMLELELLTEDPKLVGGKVQEIPGEGNVSALNIPHASMVFDLHEKVEITAELLGENGKATIEVRHADIVSFSTLKALAFADRAERKDAHDLIYCLQHFEGGMDAIVPRFRRALETRHKSSIQAGMQAIERSFTSYGGVDGHERDGPVAAARFLGEGENETPEERDLRILRQREAADIAQRLLAGIAA